MKVPASFILTYTGHFILIFMVYLFFHSALPQTAAQNNNRWIFVGTTSDGIVFYHDKTSVRKTGGKIRTWQRLVFGDGSFQINLVEWQCSRKQHFLIKSNVYTPRGSFIESGGGSEWVDITPDSIAESFYRLVCRSDTIRSDAPREAKEVRVITKLANVREAPSMHAEVVGKAVKGKIFRLVDTESNQGWYQIYLKEKETAWIHGNTIKFIENDAEPSVEKINKLPSNVFDLPGADN